MHVGRRFDATSDDAAFSKFDLITDVASDNDIGLASPPNRVFELRRRLTLAFAVTMTPDMITRQREPPAFSAHHHLQEVAPASLRSLRHLRGCSYHMWNPAACTVKTSHLVV
jgi:hypothetical protein